MTSNIVRFLGNSDSRKRQLSPRQRQTLQMARDAALDIHCIEGLGEEVMTGTVNINEARIFNANGSATLNEELCRVQAAVEAAMLRRLRIAVDELSS